MHATISHSSEWQQHPSTFQRISFWSSLGTISINVWIKNQGETLEDGGVSWWRAGTVNNGIGSGQWPVAESSTAMVSVAEAPLIPLTLILHHNKS